MNWDWIDRMKIAAYQAPLLENGSMEALSYLRTQNSLRNLTQKR